MSAGSRRGRDEVLSTRAVCQAAVSGVHPTPAMDTAVPTSSAVDASATDRSALREHADAVFAKVSPYAGQGFRNHCQRLFRFSSMLLEQRGLQLDRDLLYMITMWHDLGIVSEQDEGHNYLQRSRALFHRESAGLDLGDVDPQIIDECLLYNHRLLPVSNLSPQADCIRRAVITEHTRGLARWGLDRAAVREVFAELPRDNFDRVLVDFTWRTLKREPLSIVHGIFF